MTPIRSGLVALCLLLAPSCGTVAAADLAADAWPQFHRDAGRTGDNPQAVLTFPLVRTTAVRFPAPIYASPAVVDGKVYVQDARGHVACVDARKNRVVWTTPVGGFNNTSSPAIADGKVFVGSTAGHLAILDARTGKPLGRVPAPGGVIAAPAVANGSVYFSTFDGALTKIDFAGKVLWTFDGGRISIVDFSVRDRQILFFAGTANTTFYHLEDLGDRVKVLNKIAAPGKCCPVGGPAWVGDGACAFPSFDSETGWFCLFPLTRPPGKKGLITDVNDSRAVPAVRDNVVYRGDRCFEADGDALTPLWRADTKVLYDGGFHSSPALGKDILAVGSELGVVHFFALDGTGKVRKPVWQFKVPTAGRPNSAVSSSPALVDGAVYFGGEDGILYGLGQGAEAEVVDVPVEPEAAPKVARLKGSEWPTPGGDAGLSCVSPDLHIRPPFDIAWKTRVWSTYKGPMVVAEGKVFCAGRTGPLTALDARTGEILWKTHHPGVESRPAPTYSDGKLVLMRSRAAQGDSPSVSGASGGPPGEGLYCHDAATGKTLWHRPMQFKYHFNHDALPVHDGKVFVEQLDAKGAVQFVAYALDTGKEVWRRGAEELQGGQRLQLRRFSGVIAGGLWCVSLTDRGTIAMDPATGETVWSNKQLSITLRSRLAARDGALVVFNATGDHALDAKTGKLLWTGVSTCTRYSQALTDRYMESRGRDGVYPNAVCAWPVYVNGFWYHHNSYKIGGIGSNRLVGTRPPATGELGVIGPQHVAWSFDFLSNACPSPSPAYGRLYYSPNAEGVIYCFVNSAK